MPQFTLSGVDVKTGKLASRTVRAATASDAIGLHKMAGLRVECLRVDGMKADQPSNATALGLSAKGCWWMGLIGIFLAPAGVGLLMIVWAIVAQQKLKG